MATNVSLLFEKAPVRVQLNDGKVFYAEVDVAKALGFTNPCRTIIELIMNNGMNKSSGMIFNDLGDNGCFAQNIKAKAIQFINNKGKPKFVTYWTQKV